MGKARRLIVLALKKRALLSILATTVAIIGSISAVLGIVDVHFGLLGTSALAFVAFILSGTFHFRNLGIPQVAVDDVIGPAEQSTSYILHCPCDIKLATEASELAEECYSGSITIEAATFEQFRVKNPLILSCLTDLQGQFMGYFDVIPLRETFGESLLQGRVTESQITHEDVLSPAEMKACKYVFVSGIAAKQPESYLGRRSASVLVWALLKYLDRYYGRSSALVFALAATEEGDKLLQRFKLQLAPGTLARRDRYRLYSLSLSHDEIIRRLACVPNWEQLCDLPWGGNAGKQRKIGRRRPALPEAKALSLA
ncbi:hypothetical protein LQG66_18110 [Bradyrhizobium ontarionense]|uniref:N-acetyltransferase domain-containing protein n=1 Tax=Bradyrhizobium ontarionense TaxID=2898149 RepID=A0ABY3RNM1_9BRAD|nr:hypothetical protein [Bradyrhizobium sp. A19]UFZ08084.1 hypothetical protein LQG66_18110 [Bradyrhizobium sp. A19]